MNTNQYTQKTLEALQAAQQLAVEYQHNALEPEHLLHALASQEQGVSEPNAQTNSCIRLSTRFLDALRSSLSTPPSNGYGRLIPISFNAI